jgi:hypothetical protein
MITTNLVIGGSSRFGKELSNFLPGEYLSKQQLDLRRFNVTPYTKQNYNNLIILSKGNSDSVVEAGSFIDGVIKLLDSLTYKNAWIFTSGMGTYQVSKNNESFYYSIEKNLLNFISYKRNFVKKNIILIQPGRMDSIEEYQEKTKLFLQLLDNPPDKNLIWDLSNNRYMPY